MSASQPQPSTPPAPYRAGLAVQALLLGTALLGIWWWRTQSQNTPVVVDYSTFHNWVMEDKVASIHLDGDRIDGRLRSPERRLDPQSLAFYTVRPNDDASLVPRLLDKQVELSVATSNSPILIQLLVTAAPWMLIIGISFWFSRRAGKIMSRGPNLDDLLKNKDRKFDKTTTVTVNFDDVAGLNSAKRDLQEVVQLLKDPERFRRLGAKVPRGILLVGPPGTGKTLLARAVAGESGVPFFSTSASEFIEMFVGVGAARVRALFLESKKAAPAIVFIDEIDAVGRSRGTGLGNGHDEREQTLNQLLSEMDGFHRNDLTIVLAATNRPDVLDSALLRPGRFDRRVMVGLPEVAARRAILEVHVRDKPLGQDIDLAIIAKNTAGFSGAELANLANEAALNAARRGSDSIEISDFREALDKIILGDPSELLLGAQEKRRVAVHESGHAVVARFSTHSERLHRVTILPRGMALGVTQQVLDEDQHILTELQLSARLRVLMGGYAAERLVFNTTSTGAENDLKHATQLATKMVAHYGMSKGLGAVYYEHNTAHPFLGQRMAQDVGSSDATTYAIETEARQLLEKSLREATQLLTEHRASLNALAERLLEQETLERADLLLVLGEHDATTLHDDEQVERLDPFADH